MPFAAKFAGPPAPCLGEPLLDFAFCPTLGLKQLGLVHPERFELLGRLEGLHLGRLGGVIGLLFDNFLRLSS